jgi:hypothetical protein
LNVYICNTVVDTAPHLDNCIYNSITDINIQGEQPLHHR